MNKLANDRAIHPASSVSPTTLHLQSAEQVSRARLGSSDSSSRAPRVPLSATQTRDYLDLILRADELLTAGRQQEASRIDRLASNILRTGAPALE